MDEGFSSCAGEEGTKTGDVAEVEKSSFSELVYVGFECEIIVKNDSKVADVSGRGKGGVVKGDGGVGSWSE